MTKVGWVANRMAKLCFSMLAGLEVNPYYWAMMAPSTFTFVEH
jgi:hypothetical protein